MCQSSVACVAIQNVCPEDKFFEMVHNNDPVFLDFLLTLCVWINIQFVISHITKGYVGYVGSWMYVFEFDLFTQRHSVEFCNIHYPKIEIWVADSWCFDACLISWVLQYSLSYENDWLICASLQKVSVVTIVICALMKFYLVLCGVTNPNIISIVVVVFSLMIVTCFGLVKNILATMSRAGYSMIPPVS